MSQHIHIATDATFDAEITQQPGLVLVDFWAPWCGPCKTLAPLLEELAADYADQVRIVKINADDNQEQSARLAVRSLPTLILFQDGQERERVRGITGKSRLAALFDDYLEA